MTRKLDWTAFCIASALLFGTALRFWPAITNRFPLNDGGMFYTMAADVRADHFLLPAFTTYNHAQIPFAYPPLGLYAAASLLDLVPGVPLLAFLWLPALVSTITIIVYYKLAAQILRSRFAASLAVLVYALTPDSFVWPVMGGGITRALGIFFLLLFLWACLRLLEEYSVRQLVLSILLGAAALLSHPQTALHAVLGGALIFAFYGRSKRGLLFAIWVSVGIATLTAPWWWLVLARHGLAPFLSASQSSPHGLDSYLALLSFIQPSDYLLVPRMILSALGVWTSLRRRELFLVVMGLCALLIDPRGGGALALPAACMLAGVGLLTLLAWIGPSDGDPARGPFMQLPTQLIIIGLITYFVMSAGIFDLLLVNTSLKADDREVITWVKNHIPAGKTFLLATGRKYSMSDPLQEWFPALSDEHSATTMQGLEWTLGARFFPRYAQVIEFQQCADVQCVQAWSARNAVDFDYLLVKIPVASDRAELTNALRSLADSARGDNHYELVYQSTGALVFELHK